MMGAESRRNDVRIRLKWRYRAVEQPELEAADSLIPLVENHRSIKIARNTVYEILVLPAH